MKISVIIPTQNRQLDLKRALRSVCSQTRQPDEIIVVDDASEIPIDIKIAGEIECDIPLKVKRLNMSVRQGRARNIGANIAKGDILMFLDDDDTWEPTKVSDQLVIFEQEPDTGLVYSGRLVVNELDREKIVYRIKPQKSGYLYPDILYKNFIGSSSSVAIRKSIFKEVGCFEECMAWEDYELWIRCCKKTIVKHDNCCNVRYTISNNYHKQSSRKSYNRHLEAVHILQEKYSYEINSQGLWNARKIYAERLFALAKSMRYQGLNHSLPWILRSLWQFPKLKTIVLLLPPNMIQLTQSILHKE
ncbi:glycosyltransferase family 2 protein [Coleofasciculus sp. E1-EBD-02]|uniref:glycosyltransferase family 2 protein n=1 Tax=Coleofasciculus sp. E1-EBD-02 TaxID=3068481 RepID=UPI0032FC9EDF